MRTRTLRFSTPGRCHCGGARGCHRRRALAQGAGKSSLIGKLEGPEVVTDTAKVPKNLRRPPAAALVKSGTLPPVAERVGQDPLVIKPLTRSAVRRHLARRLHRSRRLLDRVRLLLGPRPPAVLDYTATKVTPNIAKGYEMQTRPHARLHLRADK